ncbi:hypothetical protein Tco_0271918 [Tanacetum coccineum]
MITIVVTVNVASARNVSFPTFPKAVTKARNLSSRVGMSSFAFVHQVSGWVCRTHYPISVYQLLLNDLQKFVVNPLRSQSQHDSMTGHPMPLTILSKFRSLLRLVLGSVSFIVPSGNARIGETTQLFALLTEKPASAWSLPFTTSFFISSQLGNWFGPFLMNPSMISSVVAESAPKKLTNSVADLGDAQIFDGFIFGRIHMNSLTVDTWTQKETLYFSREPELAIREFGNTNFDKGARAPGAAPGIRSI